MIIACLQDVTSILSGMSDLLEDGYENGFIFSYAINEEVVLGSRIRIEELHFHPSDALHIFIALTSECDYFLTADHELIPSIQYAGTRLKSVYVHDRNDTDNFFADVQPEN